MMIKGKKRYRVKPKCTIRKDGRKYRYPDTIELTDREAMIEFWRDIEFTDPGQVRALEDKVNEEYRNGRRTAMLSKNQYLSTEDIDAYLKRH